MRAGGAIAADLAKGAAAGAAGVWVMDRVDWFMVGHGNQEAWRQTQAVRPNGKDPAHNMAGMVAKAVGAAPPPQPHPAGIATHYTLGMAPAAAYAVARRHLPGGVMSRGLLLGLGLFLIEDELVNPLIGASAGPRAYPKQAHMRGLVSHLVLGLVTEALLSALDRPRRPTEQHSKRRSERSGALDGETGRRPSAPVSDAYVVRFSMEHEGEASTVVVTHEALHKIEAAATGGPVDQNVSIAAERHRPFLEEVARHKIQTGAVEEDGSVKVTTGDVSRLRT